MARSTTIRSLSAAALGGVALAGAAVFLLLVGAAVGNANVAKDKASVGPIAPERIDVQYNPLHPGQVDFVVSDIKFALGPDADKSDVCAGGMTTMPTGMGGGGRRGDGGDGVGTQRREGETEEAFRARMRAAFAPGPGAVDACLSPEQVGPDANYKTVGLTKFPVDGIDLDGQASTGKGRAAGATCAHDDFRGTNGEPGIDNQFFRAVGCTPGFQSTGAKNSFAIGMLTGSWGIVISLKGVDSPLNDDHVEVGIHANADPIQLSPARQALTHVTYATDPNPRFQAKTKGRIVNGVLTTDPVDVRFHHDVNAIHLERPLDQARLRLTFNKDGSVEGILAGYNDVDELYDFLIGMRSGKDAKGNPLPDQRKRGTARGSASSAGFTCNGIYHALKQQADGGRDPVTGQCSSISIQYRIKAVPAFVVEQGTPNTNLAGARLK